MGRKVFRTGNSIVVSLPREIIETLGISEGSEVDVELDHENHQVIIRPTELALPADINETFARQVAEVIEVYRPALEALAK